MSQSDFVLSACNQPVISCTCEISPSYAVYKPAHKFPLALSQAISIPASVLV